MDDFDEAMSADHHLGSEPVDYVHLPFESYTEDFHLMFAVAEGSANLHEVLTGLPPSKGAQRTAFQQ